VTQDEKLNKVIRDFSTLTEEKQDYVLGILQALVFASDEEKRSVCTEISNEDVGKAKVTS
jgi:hypothetical protein